MAVLGTIIPWYFFSMFIAENGVGLSSFFAALYANGAAGGFSSDIFISAAAFWVWSFYDSKKEGVSGWWVMIPATLLVGLSLALPLYLYKRVNVSAKPD